MSIAANTSIPPSDVDLSVLAAAYVPVHLACSAWDAALYVAGEVDTPALTLPCSRVGDSVAGGGASPAGNSTRYLTGLSPAPVLTAGAGGGSADLEVASDFSSAFFTSRTFR